MSIGFINKEQLLEQYFVCQDRSDHKAFKRARGVLKAQVDIRETFTMQLSYTGIEVKYYSDDKLYEKFGDTLPDNIDGDALVFFNVKDACRTLGIL